MRRHVGMPWAVRPGLTANVTWAFCLLAVMCRVGLGNTFSTLMGR